MLSGVHFRKEHYEGNEVKIRLCNICDLFRSRIIRGVSRSQFVDDPFLAHYRYDVLCSRQSAKAQTNLESGREAENKSSPPFSIKQSCVSTVDLYGVLTTRARPGAAGFFTSEIDGFAPPLWGISILCVLKSASLATVFTGEGFWEGTIASAG